jgi:hypothetical protein
MAPLRRYVVLATIVNMTFDPARPTHGLSVFALERNARYRGDHGGPCAQDCRALEERDSRAFAPGGFRAPEEQQFLPPAAGRVARRAGGG